MFEAANPGGVYLYVKISGPGGNLIDQSQIGQLEALARRPLGHDGRVGPHRDLQIAFRVSDSTSTFLQGSRTVLPPSVTAPMPAPDAGAW
jgi:hypothetical protein